MRKMSNVTKENEYKWNSNETNQAGPDDIIASRSRDKLKTLHLPYQSVYGH